MRSENKRSLRITFKECCDAYSADVRVEGRRQRKDNPLGREDSWRWHLDSMCELWPPAGAQIPSSAS